eukprot:3316874-Prymnesium_polylepis.1
MASPAPMRGVGAAENALAMACQDGGAEGRGWAGQQGHRGAGRLAAEDGEAGCEGSVGPWPGVCVWGAAWRTKTAPAPAGMLARVRCLPA